MTHEQFEHAGFSWTARPDRRADVLELCARLPDPTTSGAVPIKASQARIVWRLELGGRTVYVKRYRVRGWGERLKYLAVAPRAVAEWDAAVGLEGAGIMAAPPIAVGIARRGPWLSDALFLADEVPGEPYDRLLARLREDGADLGPLLEETAGLFARLVAANVFHPDLHGGNLLGRLEDGRPRLALVDLHALRFPRRLGARARARMLGKLAHSLWSMLDEPDLARALALLAADEAEALALRRAIAGVERTRLRSRSKRCVVESTEFTRDDAQGWRVWRRREAPLDALLAAVAGAGPDRPTLTTAAGPREVEVLRPEQGALGLWKATHALRVRRVPTPLAFACLERLTLGRVREAALVREASPGARPLCALAAEERADPTLRAAALDVAMRLHAIGLRAAAPDLVATRDAAGAWRVLAAPSPSRRPTDHPVAPADAAVDLAALRALLAPCEHGPP